MSARIVFFPGLGCDHRMVEPNRGICLPFDVPRWLKPRDRETVARFSRRMAAEIDTSTPFYLAGVSLGAMVAQEVARHLPCRGLILLAGCRSNQGLPLLYRMIGRTIARAPHALMWPGKRVVPRVRVLFGMRNGAQVALFEQMLGDTDEQFFRWGLDAIQNWAGTREPPAVPTFQIHGTHDRILPFTLAGQVDHAIWGAGHVMNVSHAPEVNAAVNTWLARQGEARAMACAR